MSAYYNENDPFAAAWLRELIAGGHLPGGEVDERDIRDVRPDDLAGFRQCHFFAGIGGWAHALRLAGWPDDRHVWTGSCPCQPLSCAGRRGGHADERHLWPAFYSLIAECRPAVVFGEQVASADGREWFAAVRADLERCGYAVGAADLPAAGVGAPHIRQRLFWVADCAGTGLEVVRTGTAGEQRAAAERSGEAGWVADAGCIGGKHLGCELGGASRQGQGEARQQRVRVDAWNGCATGGLGNTEGLKQQVRQGNDTLFDGRTEQPTGSRTAGAHRVRPDPAGSFAFGRVRWVAGMEWAGTDHGGWGCADWLWCRDGRWRPVKSSVLGVADGLLGSMVHGGAFVPASFPLARAQERRVMRIRGYGNAIVPQASAAFVMAFMGVE